MVCAGGLCPFIFFATILTSSSNSCSILAKKLLAHELGYMHMMSMMKYSTKCRPILQATSLP